MEELLERWNDVSVAENRVKVIIEDKDLATSSSDKAKEATELLDEVYSKLET